MKVFARGIVFLAAWAMGLPSARAVSTHYVDELGNLYAAEATAMTAEHRSWPSGWYVVSGTVVIADRVTVTETAEVNLILEDGATLAVTNGIHLAVGSSLTVYQQVNGTGTLIADASAVYGNAGIGGTVGGAVDCGSLTVRGGRIIAKGGGNSAGIGGGANGDGGTVTIMAGEVTATGGTNGAGIGAGCWFETGGSVTIMGGRVTAQGGTWGAGIGGGSNGYGADVLIQGGIVEAWPGDSLNYGIGGSRNVDKNSGSFLMAGPAIVRTTLVRDRTRRADWAGLIIEDEVEACVCRFYTLTDSLTIPAGMRFSVPEGTTLTIAEGARLTCEGTMVLDGAIVNEGILENNGLLVSTGTISGAGSCTGTGMEPETEFVRYLTADGRERYVAAMDILDVGTTWQPGWYFVRGEVAFADHIAVRGKVHLILADRARLTVENGIGVPTGSAFTVHAQSDGDAAGRLIARVADTRNANYAGIGGAGDDVDFGTVTIAGGIITATGAYRSPGIGGGGKLGGGALTGTIRILAGNVTATGGEWASGIGGGADSSSSNLRIEISGGTVNVTGGYEGAAIGGGTGGSGGTIAISGGTVTANAGARAAGIGGGRGADGGVIDVSGGTLAVTGYSTLDSGAGIGGGNSGNGGTITISGGDLTVQGGHNSAGIGGGTQGSGGTTTISGGIVRATGGANGAGIGGGCWLHDGGKITITGGEVYATGGEWGSGIGSGSYGYGADVTISGGFVVANSGDDRCYGIGGDKDTETFTIKATGSAVVFANSLTPKISADEWNGFFGVGTNTATVAGEAVTVAADTVLPAGYALCVEAGKRVTVAPNGRLFLEGAVTVEEGATFTNNGTVTGTGAFSGTIANEGVVQAEVLPHCTGSGITQVLQEVLYTLPDGTEATAKAGVLTTVPAVLPPGWYAVTGDVTAASRVTVTGAVSLVLGDSASLNVVGGFEVSEGNALTVYGQISHTGTLTADATSVSGAAGIGGSRAQHSGTVTIAGGTVTAIGNTADDGNGAAGIGGGLNGNGGVTRVLGGVVTARGGSTAAGIGGGCNGDSTRIEISGGVVEARGGSVGAGIGAGCWYHDAGIITISGGIVKAYGGDLAAGIGGGSHGYGGTITISGGFVSARPGNYLNYGYTSCAGIGPGGNQTASFTLNAEDGDAVILTTSIPDGGPEVYWNGLICRDDATAELYGRAVSPTTAFALSGKRLIVQPDQLLMLPESASFENDGCVTNAGFVLVEGRLTLSPDEGEDGSFVNEGVLEVAESGTVDFSTGADFTLNGFLRGNGTIFGTPVIGAATLQPGASLSLTADAATEIGSLNFANGVTLSEESVLEFQIALGYGGDVVHDSIAVRDNTLVLDGWMDVLCDLPLAKDDVFPVLSFEPTAFENRGIKTRRSTVADLPDPLLAIDTGAGLGNLYFPATTALITIR